MSKCEIGKASYDRLQALVNSPAYNAFPEMRDGINKFLGLASSLKRISKSTPIAKSNNTVKEGTTKLPSEQVLVKGTKAYTLEEELGSITDKLKKGGPQAGKTIEFKDINGNKFTGVIYQMNNGMELFLPKGKNSVYEYSTGLVIDIPASGTGVKARVESAVKVIYEAGLSKVKDIVASSRREKYSKATIAYSDIVDAKFTTGEANSNIDEDIISEINSRCKGSK